jgi:hypothetical protein
MLHIISSKKYPVFDLDQVKPLMAHFAVRALMHEAALTASVDPDRLSFIHAVRVVRRKLTAFNAIPPCAEESLS